ncbi:protein-glutamine gamma-glutamyltransferase [Comamonadaceae bacterium OS-4]|nr:protein-glutamine gamma-glutamyltransferase [Comamonadaceae bacterium OS-4]
MLQRLNHLPRDARDTLFLLGVIAWVILPQIDRLPLWCSLMAGAVLLWRGVLAWGSRPLPSRWWLLALLALATAGTWMSYRTLLGRDAGVTFIVVLLALKTLEMRARRDAFVIFFLGFFTMLSNFFFSQSLLTAAAMVVALLGLLTALVNSHMPVGRPPLMQAARTAAWMALAGAPIMAALFMLFPRIAPLWGLPGDAMSGRSGLSGQMQVGTIASLALDDSIAMRIRFEGATPPQRDMYFRGPVFSSFDGKEWRPLRSAFPQRMQLQPDLAVQGPAYSYQVTLAANNRPWLMVLDATPQAPEIRGYSASMGPDLQWQANQPIADLVRYRATSYPEYRHGPNRLAVGLQDYLDLPPGFNPRTLQLAADLRRQPGLATAGAQTLVDTVMDKLRTGGYEYTLEPGVYGTHTADEFWFDRKAGFCEHIASSFVLLMRALDVPARIVTGYQGGQVNNVDSFWTVRQSDAHAWAEVWMAGRGWVRVDPTSAVSPGRTGTFQRLAPQPGVLAQALNAVSPGFTLNLRALWEATNNRWNQWVLNYSQAKQMDLLRNLGFSAPDWQDLSTVLIGLIVAASLTGAGWNWWNRLRRDPWLQALETARQQIKATGLPVAPGCTPRALALLLQADPRANPLAVQWLLQLEALRYGKTDAAGALRTARLQLRTMRWLSP